MGRVTVQLPTEKPLRDRAAKVLEDALGVKFSEKLLRWDGWVIQVEGERRILPKEGKLIERIREKAGFVTR